MKKALLSVVAIALAATFALPAFADEAKKEAKKEAKAEKAKSHQFTGEITAVDAAAKTVTLKNKKDETKTFAADAAKVATGDKKEASLADLKVGDKVVASYVEEGGKNVASKIGPPAPPKEKKAKEEKPKEEKAH